MGGFAALLVRAGGGAISEGGAHYSWETFTVTRARTHMDSDGGIPRGLLAGTAAVLVAGLGLGALRVRANRRRCG